VGWSKGVEEMLALLPKRTTNGARCRECMWFRTGHSIAGLKKRIGIDRNDPGLHRRNVNQRRLHYIYGVVRYGTALVRMSLTPELYDQAVILGLDRIGTEAAILSRCKDRLAAISKTG